MIAVESLIAVCIVLIIWYFLKHVYQKSATKAYKKVMKQLDGNGPTRAARAVLKNKVSTRPKRATDMYDVAVLYDYHMGNQDEAQKWYTRALEHALNEPEDLGFIVDRVGDRIQRPATERDEYHGDFGVAMALQQALDNARHTQPHVRVAEQKADELAVRQTWHEDTQNVHDTVLSDTVASHYEHLKMLNRTRNTAPSNIQNVIASLRTAASPDRMAAIQMVEYIQKQNAEVVKLGGESEPRIIGEVWSMSQRSPETITSFIDAMKDSWNGGSPVCITGRTSRAIASLAHLVPEAPLLGVLKTKEAIKNEIFNEAHLVLQKELQRDAPTAALYEKDIDELAPDDQLKVRDLQQRAMVEISKTVDKYSDQLKTADIQKIKEECQAAIS